jgi:hypothetical protein
MLFRWNRRPSALHTVAASVTLSARQLADFTPTELAYARPLTATAERLVMPAEMRGTYAWWVADAVTYLRFGSGDVSVDPAPTARSTARRSPAWAPSACPSFRPAPRAFGRLDPLRARDPERHGRLALRGRAMIAEASGGWLAWSVARPGACGAWAGSWS